MTSVLVEVQEARPETWLPCQGEPRSLGFASVFTLAKTKTRRWRVKIDIYVCAIYPD
jgi:hypothetical protein